MATHHYLTMTISYVYALPVSIVFALVCPEKNQYAKLIHCNNFGPVSDSEDTGNLSASSLPIGTWKHHALLSNQAGPGPPLYAKICTHDQVQV